jgi:glyoxylase-like metal-dependent hydrolase (beta-lactamase superfamily II)
MNRTVLVRVLVGLVACLGAWVAYTQNPQAPAQNTLQKIKDDLYMIEGDGGNVAIYLTSDGVILVDDKFERDFNDIITKVKSLTDKPIKYVLNTHHHPDHSGSNEKLLITAEIITQRNARANMVTYKQPGLPRLTFGDEFQVFLGGKEVQAHHYGRGHTNGDAVIYFPALRVLHTGDLFTVIPTFPPLIDYAGGGSAIEWSKTLDEVLKLDFDTVIPGHGPVSKREDIIKFKMHLESMRNRVRSMNREHKSRDEIGKVLMSDYHWQDLHMQRSLDGLIAEMK